MENIIHANTAIISLNIYTNTHTRMCTHENPILLKFRFESQMFSIHLTIGI